MSRRVFISVLGTSKYSECRYRKDDFLSTSNRFIQIATLEYLNAKEWDEKDKAYFLLTDKARSKNWENCEERAYNGLSKELESAGLPIGIETIEIPEGKEENEIWEIFDKVYDKIEKGDELYFDVTHGFRYLPMLVLVLGNYSKFLNETDIKHITYGNYESKNENNEAPIIDLLPLVSLQDLSTAASDFKMFGKMGPLTYSMQQTLHELSNKHADKKEKDKLKGAMLQVRNNINTFESNISTCRSQHLESGKEITAIRKNVDTITKNQFIPTPMKLIIEEFTKEIKEFQADSSHNLDLAIEWCKRYGMIQQAYTLGQERIISKVCNKLQSINDFDNKKQFRQYVSSILGIDYKQIEDESKWNEQLTRKKEETRKVFSLSWIAKLRKPYSQLAVNRNHINHAGTTDNIEAKTLISQFDKLYSECCDAVETANEEAITTEKKENKKRILINFSNHPLTEWDERQRREASEYGECIDMAFPAVEPTLTTKEIYETAEAKVKEILKYEKEYDITVHIMGEMTLCYRVITLLKKHNIKCISSCSQRNVTVTDNVKHVVFNFERFREY